jgi:carbonic anhydrase
MFRVVAVLLAAGSLHGQEAVTPDEALKRLKEGNTRFVADKLQEAQPPTQQRLATAPKQRPIAVILTCADSRLAPEFIFDKGIGVLFVMRVAGNVTGPEMNASAEYAAAVLNVPLVVVLGHSGCGAVETAVQDKPLPSDNLKKLIGQIDTGGSKDLDAAIRANVLRQTALLTQQSKILKDFDASGRIKVVPAVYDLKTGEVQWLVAK